MIGAILGAIGMVLATILDIITLPFRILFALLRGADWEFRKISRPRHRA